ncbi:MAG TPA: AsmA family protein, partial [Chromatiales bacterium]|nr:AsmA family protein [Chromatiales bacterium]
SYIINRNRHGKRPDPMSRWLRILLYTALGVVLLAVAAVVTVIAGGPGLARQLTQAYVTELTGREFVIEGRFKPDWGRHLSVTAENIRLANPAWASESQMLVIGHVRVVLDLWSLVAGPLRIEQVELRDVAINLERTGDHPPTWIFPASGQTKATSNRQDALPLVIGEVQASAATVRYRSPILDRPLVVKIASLRQQPGRSGLLTAAVNGDVNGLDLQLQAELGPVESLMTGRGIIYRLEARLGQSTARVVGEINELSTLPHPRLEASMQGPAFGQLTSRLGLGEAGEGPFSLSISLSPEAATNRLSVDGSLGELEIDIKGWLRNILQFDGADLQARVSGPHLGRVLRMAGLTGPDEPFALAADLQREGKHVEIRQARLEIGGAFIDLSGSMNRFPSLNDAKLDLRVQGSDIERFRRLLQIPGIASGPFEIEGHAQRDTDGTEHVDLSVSTALGRLKLNGRLGDPETYVGTTLKYELQGGRLADVGAAAGIPRLPAEPFSLDGDLSWVSPDAFKLDNSRFVIGDDRLDFEGRLSLKPQAVGSDFQLHASGGDFAQMMAVAGITDGVPAWPYQATGRLRVEKDGFNIAGLQGQVGDVDVQGTGLLSWHKGLQGTDLKLAVQGPDLHAIAVSLPELQAWLPSSDFQVSGQLKIIGSGYELKNLDFRIADALFRGSVLLNPSQDWQGSKLKLVGSGSSLAKIFPELPGFVPPPQPFHLDARVERRGTSFVLDQVELGIGSA